MNVKWIVAAVITASASFAGMHQAHADDCLEVGWHAKGGEWTYYPATVDSMDGNRVHMKYEYHHGELELKVFEKEKGNGADVIVMRGRWFEGRDAQRSGKVRLEMEKGHHRAKGWYTYGDADDAPHLDFVLRECKGHGHGH